MKILLVSPGTPDEIDNLIIRGIPYLFAKAFNAPHAVAAVAALTPPEHEVVIYDEYMRGPVEDFLPSNSFDIIGISFTSNLLMRCLQIAACAKKSGHGALVVAGGIGVETLIYNRRDDIDVVFHGEAEDTWPRFLNDFVAGRHQKVYKNVTKPDMTRVPAPRWELIAGDLKYYNSVSLQTTRGCPFDCSFCDVIYTYGRKPRTKSIQQVLDEVRKLHELGVEFVFIADDNFAGDKKYVKELLRELIPLNNSFRFPLGFLTQVDITIAKDDELLELLADCNFYNLMIGVESVNPDSLRDMNKKQNIGVSAADAIRKIQSYGMVVLTHMIAGTDSDDAEVFDRTLRFVQEAGVVHHICHPLAAPPGTRMWYDFKRQGRLISFRHDETNDKMDIITNIIPARMSRVELFEGLADYWDKVYSVSRFTERALIFLNGISRRPDLKPPGLATFWAYRKMMGRVFRFFLFETEKVHRKTFFGLLRKAGRNLGYLMPKIIYMYTFFLIDYQRSKYDAAVARQHARWERENPDKIVIDEVEIPVSEAMRRNADLLVKAAWDAVRARSANKELIYKSVLAAMMDFNDRFGAQFCEPDAFYLGQLTESCESACSRLQDDLSEPPSEMPEQPPAGFTRDIMDAFDNMVRYRNVYQQAEIQN